MMDALEEGKVECFDRNDSMMDSAWGAEKSFHQDAIRVEPPRETGMVGVEMSSWTEKRAEAKHYDSKVHLDVS